MKNKSNNRHLLYLILITISTCFLGVCYATVTGIDLTLSGTANANLPTTLFITNVSYASNTNANQNSSTINNYYNTILDSTIVLNDSYDSTITYDVTIKNFSNKKKVYVDTIHGSESQFYSNNLITYDVTGITSGFVLSPGESVTVSITFKHADDLPTYSSNTLNSTLNFKFEDYASYLSDGPTINAKILSLVNNSESNVKNIVKATKAQFEASGANETDNKISNSGEVTYMWYSSSNKTIYYYSEADKIYLNPDCTSMFQNLKHINSLDLTAFDAKYVTTMDLMFYYMTNLHTIDLSSFNNTTSLTSMARMFEKCTNLESIDLTNLKTGEVTDMSKVFYECNNITAINLHGWDTRKVKTMASMFCQCRLLTSLDISTFRTPELQNMSNMFNNCQVLPSIDLTHFNTKKVTNMERAITGLYAITSLDLSSFDTSRVSSMRSMLNNLTSCTTIYASEKFVPGSGNGDTMFTNDTLLVGGYGFTYDPNKVNKTYAVINDADHEGYFTYKAYIDN